MRTTTTPYDTSLISVSPKTPISLLEVYHDTIIEHGLQFNIGYDGALLQRHVSHKQLSYARLAEGGVCIYTMQPSDCRLCMPSPNVTMPNLSMHYMGSTYRFETISKALKNPLIISELAEVSLDIYIALWRAAQANIGTKKHNFMCWDKPFLRNFKIQCVH